MSVLDDIAKKHGKDAVIEGGATSLNTEFISSGSPMLDSILGGGFPKGRITELYGTEGSGKTTIALHLIAEAQREGHRCIFIDAEHAFDPEYAGAIGVNVDELVFSQPSHAEQALDIAAQVAGSGEFGVVVLDSVAALVPEAELAGDIGDAHVGKMARLMGQSLRVLNGKSAKAGTVVVMINQIREKVGVMFGSPETTPGGRALKFFSSVRLDVRAGKRTTLGDQVVGGEMRVKTAKNKVFPPFKTCILEVEFGKGISVTGEILDTAVDLGAIAKSGAWYADAETGEKLGQGREAAKTWLSEHPEELESYRKLISAGVDAEE